MTVWFAYVMKQLPPQVHLIPTFSHRYNKKEEKEKWKQISPWDGNS